MDLLKFQDLAGRFWDMFKKIQEQVNEVLVSQLFFHIQEIHSLPTQVLSCSVEIYSYLYIQSRKI